MNSTAHSPKNWRFLPALGGLLLVLALVLVACGGGQQSSATPTPKPGPKPGTTLLTYRGTNDSVVGVAWSPDGKYLASIGEENNTVQVWEALNGKLQSSYSVHVEGMGVGGPSWSPDGTRIASASEDGTVQVWQAP